MLTDADIAKDLDSLHVLPLSIIPFESKMLKNARMVKNGQLESMVELFSDQQSGSGQMKIADAIKELQGRGGGSRKDVAILRKLGRLSSYDVYSLRVMLREQDVPVNDFSQLKLSPEKSKELGSYMMEFTHPLIMEIYGSDDVNVQNFDDILKLFRNPDVTVARQKLDQMAQRLNIDIMEIPSFMEDYGDIFMSLAYYKKCMAEISPILDNFMHSLKEIRNNWELKSNISLMEVCEDLENMFIGLSAHLKRLFDDFDRSSKGFWDDVSAERFREVEALIAGYHTTIGSVLCALSVKTIAWNNLFPSRSVGGPVKRSEFIMTEMRQGTDTIRDILKDARNKSKRPVLKSKRKKYIASADAATSNASVPKDEKKITSAP
ncbi:MAG: hypothetical protein KAI27_01635 [Rhodospirillaceae bacterium]|nr:hypothetical protein [Rhodospirillaceae bacterium]